MKTHVTVSLAVGLFVGAFLKRLLAVRAVDVVLPRRLGGIAVADPLDVLGRGRGGIGRRAGETKFTVFSFDCSVFVCGRRSGRNKVYSFHFLLS